MQTLLLLAQGNGMFVFAGGTLILFWIIAVLLSIFWIWMLIDCLTSSLPSTEKLIWCLVIFFLHIVGALLYFFIARGGGSRHVMT
jgi:hypothetical protein